MLAARIMRHVLGLGLLAGVGISSAAAANPRWTTGLPYFNNQGQIIIWYTDQPLYFTDPGDLSASVNHAAADAMVAAAAGIWNVPTARMVLQQGGTLDEQVSDANVYAGQSGLVYPADVAAANYAAKQIAVLYDRDGSVTDLLLGSGASDPSGCRQNAVTESVDSIVPAGLIQHAVLILNGRCTGPAPEQQLQMRYQLERAFGRVLGIGWSQLNDNVFTGTPTATYAQAAHWPIMHPIDIICGPYTFQCLPQPFTLRDDDIAGVTLLYPVTSSPGPGKQLSGANASRLDGGLYFPTQEGMAGVNVIIRRNALPQQVLEGWEDLATVTGDYNQQLEGNPVTPKPPGWAGSLGEINWGYDVAGYYNFPWIPLPPGEGSQDLRIRTEAINPLYTGAYAIGSYQTSTVNPSGDSLSWNISNVPVGWSAYYTEPVPGAPGTCGAGGDGTENAPVLPASSGWWTGVFCGPNQNPWSFSHTAWVGMPVQANRSLTIEVTALDGQGLATANGARPVLGVWHAADAAGTPTTLGGTPGAFNGVVVGMTRQIVQSAGADTLRIALSDERGDGRPDYNYRARILYADTIAPAAGSGSTQVTITGMGFRPGNRVTVGGVVATVASWTATTIVATVPFLGSVLPGSPVMVDVVVTDPSTSGATVMSGAFQYAYTALPYTLALVSGPSGDQFVGMATTPSFVVKAIDVDGVSPMAGVPVVFTVSAGAVQWDACAAASCTVTTNNLGLAEIRALPLGTGPVTLQAAALGLTQVVSFTAQTLVRSVTMLPSTLYVAAGVPVTLTLVTSASQQGAAAALTSVTWASSGTGVMLLSASGMTDSHGYAVAGVTAGPLAGGAQASSVACAWTSVCASFLAQGVDPAQFVVASLSGTGQAIAATASLPPMTFQVTDGAGNPVAGAAVQIHQTVSQWTAPCAVQGRCPVAPVYGKSDVAMTSDLNGIVVVTPLQIAGPEITGLVVTSGTQGFISLTLQKYP